MKKLAIASVISLLAASTAYAEPKVYVMGDLGFSDTDDSTNSTFYALGGGVQFNKNIELEVAYNDFGDFDSGDIDFTSYSLGLNLGGEVATGTSLYFVIGVEEVQAEGTVDLGFAEFDVDDNSTEGFLGIAAAFDVGNGFVIRPKIIGHDSGDVRTFSVGIAKYF